MIDADVVWQTGHLGPKSRRTKLTEAPMLGARTGTLNIA